jgi:N-hydroxyarylamine O-acetyltransferase
VLAPDLVDAVLERLGFSERPETDRASLDALYLAWCRRVPFDNLVKRIHLVSCSADPFPNGPPAAFLRRFVRDGTGGTCWPGSGALHALLVELGFDARRGSAAMYDNLSGPIHTHGTVLVRIDGVDHWVDSSMLTDVPLPLEPGRETHRDDALKPVRSEPVDGLWRIWWTGSGDGEWIGCLLLDDDVPAEHFLARYEWSRDWSPFNKGVFATRNTDDARITISAGQRFERRASEVTSTPLEGDARRRVLIEEFGYAESIVDQLPEDDEPA